MATFTAAGQESSVVRLKSGDTAQLTLSVGDGDSMTATVLFQSSDKASQDWVTRATVTAVGSTTYTNRTEHEEYVRAFVETHSGDDVVCSILVSDDLFKSLNFRNSSIIDTEGYTAVTLRKGEATFPADVVVDGSLTVAGLNLSYAADYSETIAGAGTFTPDTNSASHYVLTLSGSTVTFADMASAPSGSFPIWITIVNGSGGSLDLATAITFGSGWDADGVSHVLANGEKTTLTFLWDNESSKFRQVESQPDPIDVDGNIVTSAGNITATAGSVSAGTTITAGTGVTATTGNITASSGNVTASGLVSAGTTITAGTGITATTGNIAASSGNVTASGLISAGTTITAGTGVTATTGNITASSGNVTASGLISAGTTITAGTGLTVTTGNIVASSGALSATGNITTSGGVISGQVGSAYTFVDRGDPSAWDASIGSGFTADSSWRDWNISSIVGAGVRLVLLRVQLLSATTGHLALFRRNGNSNNFNSASFNINTGDVVAQGDALVLTDSSGIIEYLITTTAISCNAVVRGWFVPA